MIDDIHYMMILEIQSENSIDIMEKYYSLIILIRCRLIVMECVGERENIDFIPIKAKSQNQDC
jgi:hypothetical protein